VCVEAEEAMSEAMQACAFKRCAFKRAAKFGRPLEPNPCLFLVDTGNQVRQRIAVIAVQWDSCSTARHPPLRCDACSSCTFNPAPAGLGRPYARLCLAAVDAQAACNMPAVQCALCSLGGVRPARRRPGPAAEAPRRAGRGPAPRCRVPDA